MRTSRLTSALVIFVSVFVLHWSHAGILDDARDRLAHGEFDSAATYFEKHLQSAEPSAAVYYELGQALQKSNREAEAALAYRRSLLLDPRFVVAANALAESNARLGVPSASPTWSMRFAEKIPFDPAALVGAIVFWLGSFLLIAAFAIPPKRTLLFLAGAALFFSGLGVCLLVAFTDPRVAGAHQALIMNQEGTSLYKVPSEDSSEKITTLNPGFLVKILSARGRWLHIELPNGQRGWSPQQGTVPLIPSA
jgi:tetratricopeptide (TPR) repeat protein